MLLFTYTYISILISVYSQVKYSVRMTTVQFNAYTSIYYDQIWKTCSPTVVINKNQCQHYCNQVYAYVPKAPYQNLMKYNPNTRKCQPKLICPPYLGVYFDDKKNKCFDQINGKQLKPINASPIPSSQFTYNITFVCVRGKIVVSQYGLTDCECDLGWKTQQIAQYADQFQVVINRCHVEASIIQYLPIFSSISYNVDYDNSFPLPQYKYYFLLAFFYLIKNIKYSITKYFMPWEAEILTYTLNDAPLISQTQKIKVIWMLLVIFTIFALTCYERCLNGKTKQQLILNDIQMNNIDQQLK